MINSGYEDWDGFGVCDIFLQDTEFPTWIRLTIMCSVISEYSYQAQKKITPEVNMVQRKQLEI